MTFLYGEKQCEYIEVNISILGISESEYMTEDLEGDLDSEQWGRWVKPPVKHSYDINFLGCWIV